ncbi:MAG: LytR family transcriptional regulator, partial [Staphylococcus sp.]|nr:LytR family transcriptional regulator [Staphylococcus sp.]
IFQTGLSFGIRGDKNVETLTVPLKNSYQNINTNNDGSALDIDKEKNKKAIESFLDE